MALGAFVTGGAARELARVMAPATVASTGLALEAIIIVLLGLIGAYFIPREKRLTALADQHNADYQRLNCQVAAVAVAAAVLVLVATFFMVAKP